VKNFTKSRQEFADLRDRPPQRGSRRNQHPGSVPGGIGPLCPCSRPNGRCGRYYPSLNERKSTGQPSVHEWGRQAQDGVNLGTVTSAQNSVRSPRQGTASNLDTQSRSRVRSMSVHAVEFSKTAAPPREVRSLRSAPRSDKPILGQTAEYSARIRSRGLDLLSRPGRHRAGAQRWIKIEHRRAQCGLVADHRSPTARSAARFRAPDAHQPRGSTPMARAPPRADGRAHWCRD
jgi:hypothetical protein